MTIYRSISLPPIIDHRPLLLAWRIEESLADFAEADEHELPKQTRLIQNADATVEICTNLDRDASHNALNYLLALQAAIHMTIAADGKTYEQAYGENVAAYESELMRLAHLGVRS